MSKVRFGVAGTGIISREYHLMVMAGNPRLELVAACDLDAKSLDLTAKQFRIPKTYSDFNALAKDPEIDAVLVAVPNNLHATVSVRLLEADKHVICEKPMAPTIAEAQTMLATVKKTGMKLAIAHPWRCDQDFRWLRSVVASGRLGKIFKVRCHAILTEGSPPLNSWRCRKEIAGGGALTDLGIHLIDAVSYVFDDKLKPRRVYAKAGNFFTACEVEDTATAIYEFADGLTVTVEAGWHHKVQDAPHGAIEIFGSTGYARTFPTELRCESEGVFTSCEPNLHPPRPHIDLSMYAAQIDAFIDAIVAGKPVPCDGRQGLRNVAWLAAAYESASKGEPVPYGGE